MSECKCRQSNISLWAGVVILSWIVGWLIAEDIRNRNRLTTIEQTITNPKGAK